MAHEDEYSRPSFHQISFHSSKHLPAPFFISFIQTQTLFVFGSFCIMVWLKSFNLLSLKIIHLYNTHRESDEALIFTYKTHAHTHTLNSLSCTESERRVYTTRRRHTDKRSLTSCLEFYTEGWTLAPNQIEKLFNVASEWESERETGELKEMKTISNNYIRQLRVSYFKWKTNHSKSSYDEEESDFGRNLLSISDVAEFVRLDEGAFAGWKRVFTAVGKFMMTTTDRCQWKLKPANVTMPNNFNDRMQFSYSVDGIN